VFTRISGLFVDMGTYESQVTIASKLGGLDFDTIDSEFFNLLVTVGDFDDSLTFVNVDVAKTTMIRLLDGLHDVTIAVSILQMNVSILSSGDGATLAIEAEPGNAVETEFLGNFKFSTGGDATIEISSFMTFDATTFHKAFSIQAQTPNAELLDVNATYLKAKKLKNVDDL
jgi:hypothetical protein